MWEPEGTDAGAAYVFSLFCNEPPVCDADGPYVAQCQGATTDVALDGIASSDPDGDPLTYAWTTDCPGGGFDDPTSATPILTVDTSPGCAVACTVELTVSDGELDDTCSTSVTVHSPVEIAEGLIERVQDLVDEGALKQSQAHGLIAKLEAIIDKLNQGKTGPACNQLQAFINQVNGFIGSGKLTPEQGQPLIDSAMNAQAGAGC